MIRRRLPGAVEVVTLYRSEAEEAEYVGDLEARVDLRCAGRQEGSQQVVLVGLLPVGVKLLAELRQEPGEVLLVPCADDVAGVAVGARPFPVDVDAVEDAGGGPGTAHATPARVGDVAPDEEVDAGRDESLARLLRQRRVREVLRPRPPAQ